MRRKLFALLLLGGSAAVGAADGLVPTASQYSVAETEQRLVALLEKKGMTIFNRIDHAAGAEGVGLELPPTRLVVFGNPKIGTLLMQCGRSVAVDLPMKALIWEDERGVWLAYNAADYLDARHGLSGCDKPLEKVRGALAAFANHATGN